MYNQLFQLQEEVLKTLANQKRLEILQLLGHGELAVSDMVNMLGMPQANLSQHLSVLRRFKLVVTRKVGLHVYYRLADRRIGLVIKELREFLKTQYATEPEIAKLSSLAKSRLYPIVRDPVCHMRLSIGESAESVRFRGQTYYFCASGCRSKFRKNPHIYLLDLPKSTKNLTKESINYAR